MAGAVVFPDRLPEPPALMALMAVSTSAAVTVPSSFKSLQAIGFCHGLPLSKLRLSRLSTRRNERRKLFRFSVFDFRQNILPLPDLEQIAKTRKLASDGVSFVPRRVPLGG